MGKFRSIKFKPTVFLIFILLAAFLLYIKQFLPFESVDETMIAGFVWDLHRTPFPINLYPPLFLYFHFLLSLVYKGILLFLGAVESSSQFTSTIGLSITVESARVINALLATALVYLVFRMGKKFYNPSVAFFAALLMAFNPLMVLHAHIFKSDIMVSLLITLSLYLLFRYLETLRTKFIFLSAFLYGLAVAAKYNVYVFAPVITLALFFTRKDIKKLKMVRTALILPAVMVAGFFTGAPNWLVHPLGNLRLFLEKYGFGSQSVFEPYRYYSPPQIYLKFLTTWISDFGWVFVLFFLVAIPIGFLTRGKKEILLVSFVLTYVILFGFTGFYGDRFSLPLYSSISLLIGKTIFMDLKKPMTRWKKTWPILTTLIWTGTALFLFSTIQNNLTTFNLLKTKSKSNWAQDYRREHNLVPDRFHIAFQHMTPRIKGGIKLNAEFKLRFYKRHHHLKPHFIQVVYDKYREFMKTYEKESSKLTIDFSEYKPFHLIQRPKIQPWDNDFLFLYRISESLSTVPTTRSSSKILMPRGFTMNPHTSYFPLQTYEKNPGFGEILETEYHHYLYSREKISAIKILFFNPRKRYDLSLRVNNQALHFKKNKYPAVALLELTDLEPKKLFPEYVYHLEIKKRSGAEPYYFVFWPQGTGFARGKPAFPDMSVEPIREAIPVLFSGEAHPAWSRDFYKKTGIDLSLLTVVNTVELFQNTDDSLRDVRINCVPLEPGFYTLTVTGSRITDRPIEKSARTLTLTLHSSGSGEKIQPVLQGETTTIHLEIRESIHFLEMEMRDMRAGNFLLRKITLSPDYLEYIKHIRSDRDQTR